MWDAYLIQYRLYAPDTIFLELVPEVQVTVTQLQYATL